MWFCMLFSGRSHRTADSQTTLLGFWVCVGLLCCLMQGGFAWKAGESNIYIDSGVSQQLFIYSVAKRIKSKTI